MRIPVIASAAPSVVATAEPVYVIGNKSYNQAQLDAILPTEDDIDHLVSAIAASGGRGFKLRRSIDDALTQLAVAQAKVGAGTLAINADGFGNVGKVKLGQAASYVGAVKVPLYRNGRQVTDADCVRTPSGEVRPHQRDTTSTRSDDGLWFTTASLMGNPATDLFNKEDPFALDGFRVWSGLSAHLAGLTDEEFEYVLPAIQNALAVFSKDGFPRYSIATVRGGDTALVETKLGNVELGFDLGRPATQPATIEARLVEMLRGPAEAARASYSRYLDAGFYGEV